MDYLMFPDIEAIVNYALRQKGWRAYSSIPTTPEYPLMVVTRVGGGPVDARYMDAARIQIDVWGGAPDDPAPIVTKSAIQDLAQEARVAVHELEGTMHYTPVDAWISGVDDAQGMMWLPDPDTGRDRYVFGLWVYGRNLLPFEVSS